MAVDLGLEDAAAQVHAAYFVDVLPDVELPLYYAAYQNRISFYEGVASIGCAAFQLSGSSKRVHR